MYIHSLKVVNIKTADRHYILCKLPHFETRLGLINESKILFSDVGFYVNREFCRLDQKLWKTMKIEGKGL